MKHTADNNTNQLFAPLLKLGRQLRWYAVAEGIGWCLALCVAAAAMQLGLDRLLVLGVGPRFVLSAVILVAVAREVWLRIIRPVASHIDAVGIAQLIERKQPDSRDGLLSAVAFASEANINPLRNSPAMVKAVIDRAVESEYASSTQGVLRGDRYRLFLGIAGVSLAVVVAAWGIAPDTMRAFVSRNWLLAEAAWPSSATIVPEGFEDGRMRWPVGDHLTLVARAIDRVPQTLQAEIDYATGDGLTRPMDRRGRDQFVVDIGPLAGSMRVRFRIGKFGVDEYTRWYDVEAVPRPFVKQAKIEIRPPTYAGQDSYVLPQGQVSADLIPGSHVRIAARFNHAIVEASLKHRADNANAAAARIDEGTSVVSEFEPSRRGTFYFDVRDASGLEDTRPVTYSLNLIKDPPPKARLTIPDTGELVVPNASLNLVVHCEDNLGLRDVVLVHQADRPGDSDDAGDMKPTLAPMPDLTSGQLRFDSEFVWPLLPLTLKPGDRLMLKIRGTDYQPAHAPQSSDAGAVEGSRSESMPPANVGESIAYTLRVVTPEELLAELGRREHEWRREFEQIIKTQEQLNRRVLDIADMDDSALATTTRQARIAQEARTQRQVAGRVRTVLRQFELIFGELKTNDLATSTVRKRLGQGVISPMRLLMAEDIPLTAELLERFREDLDPTLSGEIESRQREIVRGMYAILAEMIKWEGYNEAVGLLRDVLRLQKDVSEDTRAELEREIEKMFETSDRERAKP